MDASEIRRGYLESTLTDSFREVDKLIISVSSAVLSLSVAFISDLRVLKFVLLLASGWILLILAILSVMLSLVIEQRVRRVEIEHFDQFRNFNSLGQHNLNTCIQLLNRASYWLFAIGMVTQVIVLIANVI